MSNKIAVVVAIILGFVAAFSAKSYLQQQEDQWKEEVKPVWVVVARRTLRPGDVILPNSSYLGAKQTPQQMIQTHMITRDQIARYRGYVVRERIDAGQPVTVDKLDANYEKADTNTSVVESGMRAITVNVSLESGVAGLIRPGDRVDIVATFDLDRTAAARRGNSQNEPQETPGVETLYLLQNARIIALDDRTDIVGKAAERRSSGSRYSSVTLEVSPTDALRIINAQEQGRLRLMLRNRADVSLQPQEVEGTPIGVNVVRNELKKVVAHTDPGIDTMAGEENEN